MYNMVMYDFLAKKGGPSGYLYNLKNCEELNIISRGELQEGQLKTKKDKKFVAFRNLLKKYKSFFRRNKKREKFFIQNKNILEHSKINHFHTTTTFHHASKVLSLNNINLLMTHSPQPTYLELSDALISSNMTEKEKKKRIQKQKDIDIYSLKNADYVIFPCPEALSPYENFFNEINFDYNKLRYVLTGVEPLNFNLDKDGFFEQNSIHKSKRVISYIGRKNKIKGFDIFLEIAKKFENDDRVIFACAGTGMETPKLKNLVDFGWTDDPGSIINASDFVLVPNRDTYFDINMIQILSIGTPILTTPTGGNRWFLNHDDVNVFFFDNCRVLEDLLKDKLNENRSKDINKKFYNKHFTIKEFCKNYVSLFDELSEKNS